MREEVKTASFRCDFRRVPRGFRLARNLEHGTIIPNLQEVPESWQSSHQEILSGHSNIPRLVGVSEEIRSLKAYGTVADLSLEFV